MRTARHDYGVATRPKNLVVIGNGMVGHRFCEKLVEHGGNKAYQVLVLGEEPRPAYDRVNLTSYFEGKTADDLSLAPIRWYRENELTLYTGRTVQRIDRAERAVYTACGSRIPYDRLVLATGSRPMVPPTLKAEKDGIFVYRTIEDLDAIIQYGTHCKTAAVIGGGLLGLEAARALRELGLETKVIEFSARLMPRQLDDTASAFLVRAIQRQGIGVLLSRSTQAVLGNGSVTGLQFADGETLDVEMIVVSAGIQPRDELARDCGLEIAPRGGVVVNDALQTSDPYIDAIGEVACHRETVYGLVAPGYQMAETLAKRLAGGDAIFAGGDLSTKLKLMGVNVASFGDPFLQGQGYETFEYRDSSEGKYIKVVLGGDGRQVLGGVLVGDTSSFGLLSHHARTGEPLTVSTADVLGLTKREGAPGGAQ